MNMFHPHVLCFWYHSIPVCSQRLNRTIHQHISSQLVGAQFTVCMTCLTIQTFFYWFLQIIAFLLLYLCLSLNRSEHVSLLCFIHLQSFHPSVLPQVQQSNHGLPPKRVGSIIVVWKSKPNSYLFVGRHSCLFKPVQAPPTSHLDRSEDIPSHTNNSIKIPQLTPLEAASTQTIQAFTSPTLLSSLHFGTL